MSCGPDMEGPAFFGGLFLGAILGAIVCLNIGASVQNESEKRLYKKAMELGHGQYETNSDGETSWHWKGELK